MNFRLDDHWLHDLVGVVIGAGADYGRNDSGADRRVMVEYVSANPTGPSTPATPVGPPTATAWPGCWRSAATTSPRSSTSTTVACRCRRSPRHWRPARRARSRPRAATRASTSSTGPRSMPDDADPLEWGEAHAIADQQRVLGRLGVSFDTWFSERAMVATGAIEETLADLRERGRGLRRRRCGVVALHRLRRRQGPGPGQERRRVHLPAAGHRVPPGQVRPGLRPGHRRLGRGPPRLRPPHEGRHPGAGPRPGRPGGGDHPAGAPGTGR